MKYVILFILGFFAHKATLEYSNWRAINDYIQCQKETPQNPRKYDECSNKLWPTKVESLLLYQPNFWCSRSPFGCDVNEDRD